MCFMFAHATLFLMLNPFPIMWLSLFAYLFLRIMVAASLFTLGLRHARHSDALAKGFAGFINFFPTTTAWLFILIELSLASYILTGYSTQYACIVGMLFCVKLLIIRNRLHTSLLPSRHYYLILFGAFLSLFITGAGAVAFDLPL